MVPAITQRSKTMTIHRISHSDDLRAGAAESANRVTRGVPVAGKGVDRYTAAGLILVQLGAPIVADPDGIAAQQTIGAAGNLLLNGALASSGVVTLDVPRNVVVDAAGAATATATVIGTDEYGAAMRENITFNGTTAVLGKKAFKTITQIALSAAGTDVFVGTGSIIGLPFAPQRGGFLRGRMNEDTSDSGTYVAPLRSASTATSADVRGTYAPAGTLDGTNTFSVVIAAPNGPADADAFGVAQFAG
jgi:hypothetical protein